MEENKLDPWPEALSLRLGRLKSMPVETTRLEAGFAAALTSRTGSQPAPSRWRLPGRWAGWSAVAAGLLVGALLLTPMLSTREVQASALELGQFHSRVMAQSTPHAQSWEEARAALSHAWQMPSGHHQMACCLQLNNRPVACVILQEPLKPPMSLTVARFADMAPPTIVAQQIAGQSCYISQVGQEEMLLTRQGNFWFCLMGPGGNWAPRVEKLQRAMAGGL